MTMHRVLSYEDCKAFLETKMSSDRKWTEFGLLILSDLIKAGDVTLEGKSNELRLVLEVFEIKRKFTPPDERLSDYQAEVAQTSLPDYAPQILHGIVKWFSKGFVQRFNRQVITWKYQ